MIVIRLFLTGLLALGLISQAKSQPQLIPIGLAWSGNSVNANILRHNSLVSHEDKQYVAYYDEDGYVVLAKRNLGSANWEIRRTPYQGNIKDAHNSINIMVDGDGYLHMSWDHHGDPLRYSRSQAPGSLELTPKMPMTGQKESRVTYPEFYRLPYLPSPHRGPNPRFPNPGLSVVSGCRTGKPGLSGHLGQPGKTTMAVQRPDGLFRWIVGTELRYGVVEKRQATPCLCAESGAGRWGED